MGEGQFLLGQLSDALPNGALGLLIFFAPAIFGGAWILSTFFRRGIELPEIITIVVYWAVVLAIYGFLLQADKHAGEQETQRLERLQKSQEEQLDR